MKTLNSTPRQDGFWMPGEFEPHAGCWMLWPERPDGWPFGAKPAQRAYVAVASAIARFEPVTVGVSGQQFLNARRLLPDHIRVVEMSSNDAWARDYAPTFVVNAQGLVRGVDWEFNGWGNSYYTPYHLDNLVARKILEVERLGRYHTDMILEGGSIHVDGEGTLMVTEQCLLNPNRNPTLSREEIEANLKEYLNVDKIIWLSRGVYRDTTAGHVDNLCCFIRPSVVAMNWTDDASDPQYETSLEVYAQLKAATDARGRKLEIHKIHQPDPIHVTKEEEVNLDLIETTKFRRAGDRLPASYINFYIANGGVVVPQFNDPVYDRAAVASLQQLFPNREVVGILSRDILIGGGNIHCITMQQPRVGYPL
jgi:agmatine deiminase